MNGKPKTGTTIIKVEVELADYWHTTYDEFGNRIGGERTDPIFEAVVSRLVERAAKKPEYASLRKRLAEIRTEMIQEQLAPLIHEAIQSSAQKTNTFGEPQGDPTTLRALIVDEAKATLAKSNVDRYDSKNRGTLLARIIREEVSFAFTDELKEVIAQAKTEATAAVQEKAATVIAETITKMAGMEAK